MMIAEGIVFPLDQILTIFTNFLILQSTKLVNLSMFLINFLQKNIELVTNNIQYNININTHTITKVEN